FPVAMGALRLVRLLLGGRGRGGGGAVRVQRGDIHRAGGQFVAGRRGGRLGRFRRGGFRGRRRRGGGRLGGLAAVPAGEQVLAPHDGVELSLVQLLPLDQGLGQRVQLVDVLGQGAPAGLVGLVDDVADLAVDLGGGGLAVA